MMMTSILHKSPVLTLCTAIRYITAYTRTGVRAIVRTSPTVIISECINQMGVRMHESNGCQNTRVRVHVLRQPSEWLCQQESQNDWKTIGAHLSVFNGVASHLLGFLTLPVSGILLHLPLSLLLSPLLCLQTHRSCCAQHSTAWQAVYKHILAAATRCAAASCLRDMLGALWQCL